MSDEKRGFSIFYKMLLSSLCVPIAAILGTLYIIYDGQIERAVNLESTLQLQSDIIAKDIERWSEMNKKILLQNRLDQDITSLQESRQKPILDNIKATYEWLFLVYVLGGKDGYMTARSDDVEILDENGAMKHSRGDRGYFKELQSGKEFADDVLLSRTTQKPVYVLCAPIDSDKSAFCIASNLTNISTNILKTKIGETGFAFMVDKNKKLIAYGGGDSLLEGKLEDMSAHPAIASTVRGESFIHEEGSEKTIFYTENVGTDWTLVIQQDYDEAYAKLNNAATIAIIVFILTILLTLILAILISRSLSKPIIELTKITNAYSKGEVLDISVPGTDRRDEIGSLARGVTRMGKSIEVMLKKLYQT